MKYLITGGCGFLGSNLAAEVLNRGEELVVFDNLFRYGSSSNLEWLKKMGEFKYYPYDIRNLNDIETVIKEEQPDIVFHLAGQVAMTSSIINPRLDFEINAIGSFNLLDTVRKYASNAIVLYSSSNKVYGDFKDLVFEETSTRYVCKNHPIGFDESIPLDFHSPYGCSKGTADQYFLDFHRIYGTRTAVFRHSSMYGGRQHPTIDQGWVSWFCRNALEIKKGKLVSELTISGNGKQVRDLLHIKDVVCLYFKSIECMNDLQGNAYNIGGGISNSLSVIELFYLLENKLKIKIKYRNLPWRLSDQKIFISNNKKINNVLNWYPNVCIEEGINEIINWLDSE